MFLVLLVGCGQLAFLNAPPEVRLVSPEAGALVSHSGAVTFVAEVSDDYDPIDALTVQWLLADGSSLGGETTIDDEASTLTFVSEGQLPKGEPVVTVRVVDHLGESDAAEVKLLVFDDVAPDITWLTPVENGRYAAGEALTVRVDIQDPDPLTDTSMVLEWSGSAVQGVAGLPDSLPESGEVSFDLESLAITRWTLGLAVTDALGASASSTIAFDVVNGDRDNDGYLDVALGGDDCDDDSGGVHPGASEWCNGLDDDCDSLFDEEPEDGLPWYADGDDDTYGDPADVFYACDAPAGRVADDTDCDDADADVFPGAPERCNHADEDCDGQDDDGASDAVTVYLDFDEDGHGAGDAYAVCFPSVDEVALGDDCDDGDPDVYPGAPEVCDTANTDEDCDDLAEDDDPDSTGKADAWYDADGDNRGDPAVAGQRCDLGADWADNDEDCDDTSSYAWTDRTEVCEDGLDYDCDGTDANCRLSGTVDLGAADATLEGDAYAAVGWLFAALGDVDGDGTDDFAVSALLAGEIYLVRGSGLGDGLAGAWPTLSGTTTAGALGDAMWGVGDLDGDGVGDLLAGAPDDASGAGSAWLFSGGLAADVDTSAAFASTTGGSGDQLGSTTAGPFDFDGDGAEKELVLGTATGLRIVSSGFSPVAEWTGESGTTAASLAMLSDVDGDGLADALYGDPDQSAAYLVVGGTAGNLDLGADATAVFTGVSSSSEAGAGVAGLGDFDGDGLGDLAIGAPASDVAATDAGEVYVFFGAASFTDTGVDRADARITGISAGDEAGRALTGLGDADGDGLHDLAIGAAYDDTGGNNAGGAWMFYGSATFGSTDLSAADVTFVGESSGDNAGEGMGRVGDVDGDGFADLGIGAPSAGGDGRAYILLGGGL